MHVDNDARIPKKKIAGYDKVLGVNNVLRLNFCNRMNSENIIIAKMAEKVLILTWFSFFRVDSTIR